MKSVDEYLHNRSSMDAEYFRCFHNGTYTGKEKPFLSIEAAERISKSFDFMSYANKKEIRNFHVNKERE